MSERIANVASASSEDPDHLTDSELSGSILHCMLSDQFIFDNGGDGENGQRKGNYSQRIVPRLVQYIHKKGGRYCKGDTTWMYLVAYTIYLI